MLGNIIWRYSSLEAPNLIMLLCHLAHVSLLEHLSDTRIVSAVSTCLVYHVTKPKDRYYLQWILDQALKMVSLIQHHLLFPRGGNVIQNITIVVSRSEKAMNKGSHTKV